MVCLAPGGFLVPSLESDREWRHRRDRARAHARLAFNASAEEKHECGQSESDRGPAITEA